MGDVSGEMGKKDAIALVLTAMDEIACESVCGLWGQAGSCGSTMSPAGLFNLRGSDIEYNPLFFSYAIITPDDVR